VGFDLLTTCQPSTVWCSRERLPVAAAQVRQSCSATDYYYFSYSFSLRYSGKRFSQKVAGSGDSVFRNLPNIGLGQCSSHFRQSLNTSQAAATHADHLRKILRTQKCMQVKRRNIIPAVNVNIIKFLKLILSIF
jgi:hypothetical protein